MMGSNEMSAITKNMHNESTYKNIIISNNDLDEFEAYITKWLNGEVSYQEVEDKYPNIDMNIIKRLQKLKRLMFDRESHNKIPS